MFWMDFEFEDVTRVDTTRVVDTVICELLCQWGDNKINSARMADANWKKRTGLEINYSPSQSSEDDDM